MRPLTGVGEIVRLDPLPLSVWGSHYLILRETADTLELVEVFHARMDLDRHLTAMTDTTVTPSDDPS